MKVDLNKNKVITQNINNDLEFINKNYSFNQTPRLLGSLLAPFTSFISRFNESLVRIINHLNNSEQFRRQILLDDVGVRIHEQAEVFDRKLSELKDSLENRLLTIETREKEIENTLSQMDSVVKGLEAIIRGARTESEISSSSDTSRIQEVLKTDNSYLLLENRYRGSEDLILERMKPYCSLVKKLLLEADKFKTEADLKYSKILEIGCGRGELLQLLKSEGISALGIEPDEAMVRRAKDKGLEVLNTDVVQYLNGTQDNSIDCIIGIQLIEHLSNDYRKAFLDLVNRKLTKSGFLILETINTSSFVPLLQNYFRDPTHIFPLHPDTLKTLVEQSGLSVEEIIYSSEFPEEAKIPHLPPTEGMPFRYNELSRQINERLDILNRLLFSSQDYAILARKN